MAFRLVIAEKPSVAQTIAAALGIKGKQDGYIEGGGYLISWCVGHLVQLAEAAAYGEQYKKWSFDSLPILPEEWQYAVDPDKGKQFKTIKELMHRADVSEVVNACDAGREGELIFRFVYEVAGCKKPMRRLWISSMEDGAIKAGFASLKDGRDYGALFASALCRAKADWLIGINATRLFSCLYGKTLNVGRVQTPTLKMLTDRDAATLAGARLLFATAEPHIYEAVTAVFSCAGTDFTARGKTVLAEGWKELERRYRATLKDKPEAEDGENEGVTLPELSEGQNFPNPAAKVTEHTTTPPKPHSEASLLSAMERAGNGDTDPDAERRGLGTPATRAAVIEKLVKGGFAERKGKQLIPTQNGAALISVLPDMLTSPQLTAEWENNLTQIAKGAADPGEFLSGIEAMARELVQTHAAALDGKKDLFREEKPSVGKCPRCGSPVHEGKKNYYCSNKECAFVMWKNDRFFEERKTAFSAKIAAALLKSGKVNVKKLYSPKTGKTYDGTIVLADTGGKYVNYRIEVQKN